MSWLAERGAATLDADEVVHRLLAEDASIVADVSSRFGDGVVEPDGASISREALARVVFSDPDALISLEEIVHPAVSAAVDAWLAEIEASVAAVEAVKLIEGGMHTRFDMVWLVACDRSERRRRLCARGWSAEDAARRIDASPALGPQLAVADVVIDNTGSRDATHRQLDRAWSAVDTVDTRP